MKCTYKIRICYYDGEKLQGVKSTLHGVAQIVEHLPSKREALSSYSIANKIK
jgi:hypothetical protein